MSYEFTPLLIPFALSAGCLLVPWYFAEEFADERTYAALVLWTFPVVVWSMAVMLRLSATTMSAERMWHNVRFIGPAFGSVGYFLFTATYTNHERWFRRRRLWGLFSVPVITTVLVWTNGEHMLVRATTEPAGTGPFVMAYTPGPWFWAHVLYSYALVAVGTAWLVRRFWERRRHVLFRRQILSVLFGVLIVVTANGLFNVGVTAIDWTPVAGAASAVVFGVAASEYRFLDVAPLAREAVVENMDDGMVVTDIDGRIIDGNSRAAAILDTELDELIGSGLDEVFLTSTETIEETIGGSEGVTPAANEPRTVQVSDEGTRHYEINVSAISTSPDKDIGTVITFSDVTDRVERRQRLQGRKRSVESQNERLEEFTSVVSHDLRNPLNVAQGRLELAQEDCDSDHLDGAADALSRMETLIDDLLVLARKGNRVSELEAVDLGDTMERCWLTVETADTTLVTETERTIQADPSRLRQLLENLIRNAIEHAGSDRTVRIGDLEGGFYVSDDGPGIPEAEREEVFDAGYSTTEDGTGLGLNIVREIAKAHEWDVVVTDSREGGARFEITGVEFVD
ncbi:MAG: histidine kinase N-terminal 7TM domain-containing protein [Halobacteriales archaeon]